MFAGRTADAELNLRFCRVEVVVAISLAMMLLLPALLFLLVFRKSKREGGVRDVV
jgi:hypothetical protein